jgi:hypothetical protein
MLIGLHDAERDHMPEKTYPNLALMKLSAWHKQQGDTIEWWSAWDNDRYDRIYSSNVFSFTPTNQYLPDCTVYGGTGYGLYDELLPEIDAIYPDYTIYPDCDYAIGYLTRGCPYNCEWCVVPRKEGVIRPYRTWEQIRRHDTDKLVLMDNNILACEHGIQQLETLVGSGLKIDLNQGLDASLVDRHIAEILSKLRWIERIRFSCDTMAKANAVANAAKLLTEYGVRPGRLFVYLLVRRDVDDAARRVEALQKLGAITIYAMPERNEGVPPPNAEQLEFAQRYIYGGSWRKESWDAYKRKRKLFEFRRTAQDEPDARLFSKRRHTNSNAGI